MVRRIGKSVYRAEVMLVCLAGAVLAVPIGYLGLFLHQDGLVAAASLLAAPLILLLLPLCVLIPLMIGLMIRCAIETRLPRMEDSGENA